MERLEDLLVRPGWHERSACRDMAPGEFFPESPGGGTIAAVADAREVCARCAVSDDCLGYALGLSENPRGIWAGTTFDERKALRRSMTREGFCIKCGTSLGERILAGTHRKVCDRCRTDAANVVSQRTYLGTVVPRRPCVVCGVTPDETSGQGLARNEATCGAWECKRSLRRRRSDALIWADDVDGGLGDGAHEEGAA